MKALILAAGRGKRLIKTMHDLPKPLIDINGTSLIQRQINLLRKKGITEIFVIRGFKPEKFHLEYVSYIEDKQYDKHDQLGSLMAADSQLSEDVLITFGDILFDENILEQILSSSSNFAVAVDLNWTKSYEKRSDNPIELAGKVMIKDGRIEKFSENLPVEKDGCLIGEFLGIIKLRNISTVILQKHLQQLRKIHKGKFHDAKSFELAKLTDFLQDLVESKVEIDPIFVDGKWCEIDTPKDLELARKQFL